VGDVPFGPEGLSPLSVTTGDGQAAVILNAKTVPPRAGETAVRVVLVPVDPQSVAPAPAGLRFDSNAYRIDASYIPTGTPVRLRAPATVVLRYASGATGIVRFSVSAWGVLATKRYDAAQIITADTQALGLFAAQAPATLPYTPSHAWRLYGALVLLVLVVLLAFSLTRRFWGRPRG
jgi:hypothetical protein